MPPVVLIHGLWMRSPTMWPIGAAMQRAGFRAKYFNYPTIKTPIEESVEKLRQQVLALNSREVHLVGHSMGGLLAVMAAQRLPEHKGRIVALGSPFSGSAAGRWLSDYRLGRLTLGHSAELIRAGPKDTKLGTSWDLGVIAGTLGAGLGVVSGLLISPHDGTVCVTETIVPNCDHLMIKASHTGLLFSAQTAKQTINFLSTGRFAR